MDLLNDDQIDELILNSFLKFVTSLNLFDDSGSTCKMLLDDESISSYIKNAVKQFYEEYENHHIWLANSDGETFDLDDIEIDSFIEIIDAYFTGFRDLKHDDIFDWLIKLKKLISSELNKRKENVETSSMNHDTINKSNQIECSKTSAADESAKEAEIEKLKSEDPSVNLLIEMFPDLSVDKVVSSYKKSNKNYDRTIDDLLALANSYKDETELSEEERKHLKEKTVQKFGLVSEPIDPTVKYKPVTKWEAEKKMVRYYDSKVVTTKGEKYFELKTEEEEEEAKKLKKTFINLKPARKYRFH